MAKKSGVACTGCGAPLQLTDEGGCAYCGLVPPPPPPPLPTPGPSGPYGYTAPGDAALHAALRPQGGVVVDLSGAGKAGRSGCSVVALLVVLGIVGAVGFGIWSATKTATSFTDRISQTVDEGIAQAGGQIESATQAAGGTGTTKKATVAGTFVRTPGTLKISGAIDAEVPIKSITEAIGDKPCSTVAAAAKSVTVTELLPDGRRIVVAFQFRKPQGTGSLQGAGDYSLAGKTTFVVVNLIDEDGIEANGQQWVAGFPGTDAAGAVARVQLRPDGSGTFGLNELKPRPDNAAIQGRINAAFTWSCFDVGTPLPG